MRTALCGGKHTAREEALTGETRGHAEGQLIDIRRQCEETCTAAHRPNGAHPQGIITLSVNKKLQNTHVDTDIAETRS